MKDFLMPLLVGVLTFVLAAGFLYWQQRDSATATVGSVAPTPVPPVTEDGKRILPALKDYSPQQYNTMVKPAEFQTNGQGQQLPTDYSRAYEGGTGQ
jgi:hypothetical protein